MDIIQLDVSVSGWRGFYTWIFWLKEKDGELEVLLEGNDSSEPEDATLSRHFSFASTIAPTIIKEFNESDDDELGYKSIHFGYKCEFENREQIRDMINNSNSYEDLKNKKEEMLESS